LSFIVDLPIKNGDFSFVSLPEGVYIYIHTMTHSAMMGLVPWWVFTSGLVKTKGKANRLFMALVIFPT